MKASVTWQQNLSFKCDTDTGHSLELDGNGEGLSPMESVLLSVGACSSVDVVEIMRKSRQDIKGCTCDLEATRADTPPKVFTAIHAVYKVSGNNISEKHLARAVQLSCEKYCSVMLMLNAKVDITTEYQII